MDSKILKIDINKFIDANKSFIEAFENIDGAMKVTAREIEHFFYSYSINRRPKMKRAWSRSRSHPGV